ncbi:6598_t:CDS:1, partial [Acaulospora morrowiae]
DVNTYLTSQLREDHLSGDEEDAEDNVGDETKMDNKETDDSTQK